MRLQFYNPDIARDLFATAPAEQKAFRQLALDLQSELEGMNKRFSSAENILLSIPETKSGLDDSLLLTLQEALVPYQDPVYQASVPSGSQMLWPYAFDKTLHPQLRGWVLADGTNGSGADPRGRLFMGACAGTACDVGCTGGSVSHCHRVCEDAVQSSAEETHDHGGDTCTAGCHDHGTNTSCDGDHEHGGATGSDGDHLHEGCDTSIDHCHSVDDTGTTDCLGSVYVCEQDTTEVPDWGTFYCHYHCVPDTCSTDCCHSHSMNCTGAHTHVIDCCGDHCHTITVECAHSHCVAPDGEHSHTTDIDFCSELGSSLPPWIGYHLIEKL